MSLQTLSAALLLFPALPLLLAAVTVVIRNKTVDRVLLFVWPVLQFAAAAYLLVRQQEQPVLGHNTGGFEGGVAIAVAADPTTSILLMVTAIATFAAVWFMTASQETQYRFAAGLIFMLVGGVNGALITADLFNLFVFIEVMLLPSYALIAITGGLKRLGVGRMFVVVNLVTSTILVMGVGLVYGSAGTVNLAALAGMGTENPVVGAALTLVMLALAIKAGAVPVHGWLPSAYPGTSAGMMALFSGLHTKVGVYAVMRVYFVCFETPPQWQWVITVVVIATILVGSLLSLGQNYGRGVLAYQMVSGVGHILLAIVIFSAAAISSGLFYLVHHIITMGALLLLFGAIEQYYGPMRLNRFSGFLQQEPLIAFLAAFGLLSLAGLPPTSGLWGKLNLMFAATDTPQAALLITVILLGSLLTLLALMRLYKDIFYGNQSERYLHVPSNQIPFRSVAPGAFMILLSVAMFVFAGPVQDITDQAGSVFLDRAQYQQSILETP